ncbi:thiol:disulfide interchange protein DsbA/DsbL [Nitrincola sp. A-D6]|uniref:thiol:disulfide interchange protein DsbA/DsbL n=1 Tax=Nitrincola sp. A-D6 TaxID=1545442 RepID=UPI00068F7E17|nr:thiol:disulfide interchange protein DsbA/DsbL [Nitrincola sp. A-D6]
MLTTAFTLIPFASAIAETNPDYQAGVHYQELPATVTTSDPEKIEVVAVFGYSCPHCANLEPMLASWSQQQSADNLDYKHLPVVFSRNWEPLARAYYVAELTGKVEETHQAMFDAVHVQNTRFRSVDDLAEFYTAYGIEEDEFNKLYDSFAVDTRLKQGQARLRAYQITAVPAMVVNGKYHITGAWRVVIVRCLRWLTT